MPDLSAAALSANMQDYLEAILELEQEHQVARVRDLAARMGLHVSSVSNALRTLRGRGLVNHEAYGYITLTEAGRDLALQVQERHRAMVDFLERVLMLTAPEAEEEACRLEHALGPAGLARLQAFNEFMRAHPEVEADWRGHLREQFGTAEPATAEADEEHCEVGAGGAPPAEELTVGEAAPGTWLRLTGVCGTGAIRRRLLDMGLRPGAEVLVERLAPLGDPIEVQVMDYHLSVRRSEAAGLRGEVIAAPRHGPGAHARRGHGRGRGGGLHA